MAERTVRVVIVDDHSIFRSGLRADLDASVEVVGEAADAASAIAIIEATAPDVVLLDVHLPVGAGAASGPDAAGGEAVIRGAAPAVPAKPESKGVSAKLGRAHEPARDCFAPQIRADALAQGIASDATVQAASKATAKALQRADELDADSLL